MATFAERAAKGISRCTPADLADLREFQEEHYGARADLVPTAWLEWLERNPQRANDAIPIWICRRDGRIVGQQAEIAAQLKVGGTDIFATYPIELLVDPSWRLRGVGPALAAAQQAASPVNCAIWMTDEVRRMYARGGWTDLGPVPRFVALVHAAAIARSLESTPRRLAAACAAPFAGALALAAVSVANARARSTRLVEVTQFDDRADAIWSRAAGDYRVLARRDTASLRWRFDDSPHAGRYRRFYLLYGAEPLGYAVLRTTRWRQATTLRVVDYFAPHRWVPDLLTKCLLVARRDPSVAFLDLLTKDDHDRRQLSMLGFVPTDRLPWFRSHVPQIRMMVNVADEDPLRAALIDERSWFVTGGEADLDLVEIQLESVGSD